MEFLTGTPLDIWQPLDVTGLDAGLRPMGEGRQGPDWDLGVGDCVQAAKIAAGEPVGDIEGEQPGLRAQEGFLFEQMVEYMLGGASFDQAAELAFKRHMLGLRGGVVKQVRLVRDRIRGTPDALDPMALRHESYKATRRTLRAARSADSFQAEFWTWVMQEGAYLYMAGLDTVRWVVWWQAGDYSRGKGTGPVVAEAVARYEPDELEANWRGVCAIADRLRRERGMVA